MSEPTNERTPLDDVLERQRTAADEAASASVPRGYHPPLGWRPPAPIDGSTGYSGEDGG